MTTPANFTYLIGLLLFGWGLNSCAPQTSDFAALFKMQPLPDTLAFAITDSDAAIGADTISNQLFFSQLSADMYADIEYVADSSSSVTLAKGSFELSPPYLLLWADIRYAWFQHQSLLLYDKEAKRITDRITAAELYGGESGQIIIGAWLLNGNEIVQRQDSHSSRLTETDEVEQSTERYVSRWKIEGG
ncbi:MAG TPA: hypothetical protein PLL53_18320, partial [Saprospiraceae bacterium]|nr:hypothetical protein [Saprospiraceae bacterium]